MGLYYGSVVRNVGLKVTPCAAASMLRRDMRQVYWPFIAKKKGCLGAIRKVIWLTRYLNGP